MFSTLVVHTLKYTFLSIHATVKQVRQVCSESRTHFSSSHAKRFSVILIFACIFPLGMEDLGQRLYCLGSISGIEFVCKNLLGSAPTINICQRVKEADLGRGRR